MAQFDPGAIDVSAKSLVTRRKKNGETSPLKTFTNDPKGIKEASRFLSRGKRPVHVCLESTGIYHLDVALALHDTPGVDVMVVNPRAAHNFAKSLMKRGKTDAVDTDSMLEFAERMPFTRWQPPAQAELDLRMVARRITALTQNLVREKNRLHAATATNTTSRLIRNDIEVNIRHHQRRIERLRREARRIVETDPSLHRRYRQLVSVTGIAEASALQILPELAVLPADMTPRQWVAHAGLDPRPHQSGTSIERPARMSKAGNKYLRAALFMPALVAIQKSNAVAAFYNRLVTRGAAKMQAIVAVMRKLLHATWGMFQTNADFVPERCFGRPTT